VLLDFGCETIFERNNDMLTVSQLKKSFGSFQAVRGVSFSVEKGEVLGFFGLIGAGRSEVMTALFGVDRLSSGNIYIDGKEKQWSF